MIEVGPDDPPDRGCSVDLLALEVAGAHWWTLGLEAFEHATPFRYVWPSELDLMARFAGLTLRDRWAGWDRSPFTGDSTSHVSSWPPPAL
jgi:hypothetical protein